jgi:hypothetical protein
MEKIVPVETLQSMFDEPSSGSKHTQYGPASFSSTNICNERKELLES